MCHLCDRLGHRTAACRDRNEGRYSELPIVELTPSYAYESHPGYESYPSGSSSYQYSSSANDYGSLDGYQGGEASHSHEYASHGTGFEGSYLLSDSGSGGSHAHSHSGRSSHRSHHSGRSHKSHHSSELYSFSLGGSTQSAVSEHSMEVIHLVESMGAMINSLQAEADGNLDLVGHLRQWLSAKDQRRYETKQWTREITARYEEYKRLVEEFSDHRRAYTNYVRGRPNVTHDHPDDLAERANLAMKWGQTALMAGQARVQFMVAFENAYANHSQIRTHISQAESNLQSAKTAFRHAKISYNEMLKILGRDPHLDVFQLERFT